MGTFLPPERCMHCDNRAGCASNVNATNGLAFEPHAGSQIPFQAREGTEKTDR